MRNHRLKLSDIIPNSWFFKVRNSEDRGSRGKKLGSSMNREQGTRASSMEENPSQRSNLPPLPSSEQPYLKNRASYYVPSKARSENRLPPLSHPKASDTLFPSDPKRVPLNTHRKKKLTPSPACPLPNSLKDLRSVFNVIVEHKLHPIATKPEKNHPNSPKQSNGARRSRVRLQSPRPAMKRFRPPARPPAQRRNRLPETFVVVKPSSFPRRDFTESMAEMIVENNLRSPEDLEELLACYLSLNSSEYHDMIVEVFQQIWFDLSGIFL
ncbi:hypothetical protein AXF42_Ash003526 [Apostasia shenzhenica]|uniref:Transcription repressor n=1 Tax=Apostasia shenzhenica TaxID=1088818 RepID=A0A2I0BGE3_9ASPA|nr:hypothetical protein AXF42_Ash003525 [Apostasia shenzhenica]PKA66869.1 hypothetical protein AXF42_Ash003526 [Apostasia shenzhenica]